MHVLRFWLRIVLQSWCCIFAVKLRQIDFRIEVLKPLPQYSTAGFKASLLHVHDEISHLQLVARLKRSNPVLERPLRVLLLLGASVRWQNLGCFVSLRRSVLNGLVSQQPAITEATHNRPHPLTI